MYLQDWIVRKVRVVGVWVCRHLFSRNWGSYSLVVDHPMIRDEDAVNVAVSILSLFDPLHVPSKPMSQPKDSHRFCEPHPPMDLYLTAY